VRYFFSTGEVSGEAVAVMLAQAIRDIDADASFEGIGSDRMRDAGFRIWRNNAGWASMGPAAAIPRIPKLLAAMLATAAFLRAAKFDLIVLVDFGVFNLRLANTLRRFGYRGPILDLFPPGTWLDNEKKARRVSAVTVPVTAFAHQYEFYRRIGCRVVYLGHPLASKYPARARRPAPPHDGGAVAILPGSRSGELKRHLPILAQAYRILQTRRPALSGVFGAADAPAVVAIRQTVEREGLTNVRLAAGVAEAASQADAAWAASGTAVLETALLGVPTVALYVIPPAMIWYGRRMIRHRYITLPNLILAREAVPELLQEQATPEKLAEALDGLMSEPSKQLADFAEMREALGPSDALQRTAQFAVELARTTPAA
jgi:lipid-A-disaccharide synthase